jgi:hypothetical protein
VLYLLDRKSPKIRDCKTALFRNSGLSSRVWVTSTSTLAVMGDVGKGLYVAEDVVPIYRQLLNLASIITPNQFETE